MAAKMLTVLGSEHQGRVSRSIYCDLPGVGRPTLSRRTARRGFGLPAQGCRRHDSRKQMRDVLLENQLITQENKNSTAAGQAQGSRAPSRTLPCPFQPLVTKTKTQEKDKDKDLKHKSERQFGVKQPVPNESPATGEDVDKQALT